MNEDFATYIDGERARLTEKRAELERELNRIDLELAEVDREFEAIDAYEAAKTGKANKVICGLRDAVSHARRARRGSQREAIVHALKVAPLGMSRSALLAHFGVKGDKAGEASVSNALSILRKAGIIDRDDESGRWYIPGTSLHEAAE